MDTFFHMINSMIAFIFTSCKILTLFGAPYGSIGGQKGRKLPIWLKIVIKTWKFALIHFSYEKFDDGIHFYQLWSFDPIWGHIQRYYQRNPGPTTINHSFAIVNVSWKCPNGKILKDCFHILKNYLTYHNIYNCRTPNTLWEPLTRDQTSCIHIFPCILFCMHRPSRNRLELVGCIVQDK